MSDEVVKEDIEVGGGGSDPAGSSPPSATVDAPPPSPPDPEIGVEEPTFDNELDRILAEYDAQMPAAQPAPEPQPQQEVFGKEQFDAIVQQHFEREAQKAAFIDDFRGYCDRWGTKIPEQFGPDYFGDQLELAAQRDPALQQVLLHVHQGRASPAERQALNHVAHSIVSRARKQPPAPDPLLTADREMVAQSMRSASGPAPREEAPNLGQMDTAEYRDYVKRNYGINAGV